MPARLRLVRSPSDPRPPAPDFGRVSAEHLQAFLAISQILHTEPTSHAFGRLLKKRLEQDDYVLLAHLFEEVSVLALHHLIPEALLFDAFAFDLYWDELREDVMRLRSATGNEKFCENFELASQRAREYRADRPPKTRWKHHDEGEEPPEPPDGIREPIPDRPLRGASTDPASSRLPR
jgi:hypothetical protein